MNEVEKKSLLKVAILSGIGAFVGVFIFNHSMRRNEDIELHVAIIVMFIVVALMLCTFYIDKRRKQKQE